MIEYLMHDEQDTVGVVVVDIEKGQLAQGRTEAGDQLISLMIRTCNGRLTAAEALEGTMLPMAGHKGYALALMVEVFSGVLSGAAIGPAVGSMYNNMDRKQNVGHFFCLLDISAFMDIATFKRRIDTTIEGIKSYQKRPGADDILIPGERSHQKAQQAREQGIYIEEATRKELKLLCEELGAGFRLN